MSTGDSVKRVNSREFSGFSPLQPARTGVKLMKTRVAFVGIELQKSRINIVYIDFLFIFIVLSQKCNPIIDKTFQSNTAMYQLM